MFAKSEHLNTNAGVCNLLERLTERLTVGRGHHQRRQPFGTPLLDVGQHVAVDVAVLVDLRFGEDGEPRLVPVAPDDVLPVSVARPITKYETKAHEAGSAVTEFIWRRE